MTLKALFTENGTTSAEVAAALFSAFGSIDPVLFERIDQARQGLPQQLIIPIANVLDVEKWEVETAASKLTTATGPLSRTPLPPRLGDEFQAAQYALPAGPGLDTPFVPNSILGQQIFGWYRSDLDVVVFGGLQWGDQSVANNPLSEASRPPTYVNDGSGINGLPYLQFTDAGFDEMEFPALGITGTSALNWTFIFVIDAVTVTGTQEGNLFSVWSGAADDFSIAHEVSGGTSLGYFNNGVWTSIAAAVTGPQILAFVFDEDEAECRVYRNNVLIGTGPYVPFDITPGGLLQQLGGSSPLLGASTRTPDVNMYEVIAYGQPIDTSTPDEWARLYGDYLFPRYGLP